MKISRRQLRRIIKEEFLREFRAPGQNQHTYRVEFNKLLPGNMELTHDPRPEWVTGDEWKASKGGNVYLGYLNSDQVEQLGSGGLSAVISTHDRLNRKFSGGLKVKTMPNDPRNVIYYSPLPEETHAN